MIYGNEISLKRSIRYRDGTISPEFVGSTSAPARPIYIGQRGQATPAAPWLRFPSFMAFVNSRFTDYDVLFHVLM